MSDAPELPINFAAIRKAWAIPSGFDCSASVSYTHLTLPTNREV